MKIVAIIQARMSSERLAGKVLKDLNGTSLIQIIVERANKSNLLDEVVIATSDDVSDKVLFDFCQENRLPVFRGNLSNVLKRYYDCATEQTADIIVRLTGDNPLIDPQMIDNAISIFLKKNIDYLNYCNELPIGMHIEVFSYEALKKTYEEADDMECKEHVTLFMYKNKDKFNCVLYSEKSLEDKSYLRWTVDTYQDYELVNKIFKLMNNRHFMYREVLELYEKIPELYDINKDVVQKQTKYKVNEE